MFAKHIQIQMKRNIVTNSLDQKVLTLSDEKNEKRINLVSHNDQM